jgi:hypothetical protein
MISQEFGRRRQAPRLLLGTMMAIVVEPFVGRRARARLKDGKAFSFRNSSRRRPLKLSTLPFCIGGPGSVRDLISAHVSDAALPARPDLKP